MAQGSRILSASTPGMSRLAMALAGGDGAYQQGYDKQLGLQSKLAQAMAAARAADANAEESLSKAANERIKTGMLQGRPALVEEMVANAAGADVPLVRDIRSFVQTGRRQQVPMGPETAEGDMGVGSQQFDPAIQSRVARELQRLAPVLMSSGDIKVDDWAKALNQYRGMDLGDDVLAGRRTAGDVGRSQAAVEAKPLYNSDANGAVLDLFGGALDVNNPMAQGTISLKKEQAGAQKANAVQSYASADASRASAAKTRADMLRGDGEGGIGMPLPVLGAPVPNVLPWQNQSNSKDANKVKAAEITRGSKAIEQDVEEARKEAGLAAAAERFIELNSKVGTGTVLDKSMLGRTARSMGSDYAEMESITAKLAPAMRQPGSGASSDYDGKQFERATVGVDKPKQTNENIARAVIARSRQAQDYADFRRTYLEQNGTLQGADRYWKQYVDSNPIFDPSKPGTFQLNQNRRNWREHFSGAPAAAPAPSPAPGTRPTGRNVVVDF